MDIYKHLHPDLEEPAGECEVSKAAITDHAPFCTELLIKRGAVVNRLQELEEDIEPVVRLFEDPDVAEHMKRSVVPIHWQSGAMILSTL